MIAKVQLWGRTIGAVSSAEGREVAAFQYAPEFAASGIELSPLVMPLSERVYEFPTLPRNTFYGLPGLLADSLPDKFGNALIDAWLATQGRTGGSFSAVERLCYTGARGMGALEFFPALGPKPRKATRISVDSLVRLAGEVLTHRGDLQGHFHEAGKEKALRDILRVGTSAGGARAKAVIAWNRETNEVRSGQIAAGDGFDYWLLKFDGVAGNKDKELEDPKGYGAIEFAYHLMAKTAGITVTECRLLEENGRRHFMTRRFDRLAGGEKLHMQSLCALAHFDFNQAGAYAYEQALLAIRQLKLPMASVEEQFRRMVFNIVARNQDDHVKNIAFLMNKQGEWLLAPAFDVTYSYNPSGSWTATHQMTLNAKRDEFTL
ncbi:MAG TPA: HipA domain-containing protein, partial [Patescibacteria group bacterium]|nr:HipA domain-containing protein [Patescibacteria group bacterium]